MAPKTQKTNAYQNQSNKQEREKMGPCPVISGRLSNVQRRLNKLAARVLGWGADTPAPAPELVGIYQGLTSAATSLGDAIGYLDTLGGEFKPQKRGAKPKLEIGSSVEIRESKRGEYVDIIGEAAASSLVVEDVRPKLVVVRTADGKSRLFFPRGHVRPVAGQSATN